MKTCSRDERATCRLREREGRGIRREIRQGGETAEGLPQDAPPLGAEMLAHGLAVAHDRGGAQMGDVLGELGRIAREVVVADG